MAILDNPVSFLATAKSSECREFYETALELPCLSDEPYALVFDLGATRLRIQKVDTLIPVNHTVLGWEVSDIQSSVEALALKKIRFEMFPQLTQNDRGIWKSPGGASVAWFKDPDGNTLSLTQPW